MPSLIASFLIITSLHTSQHFPLFAYRYHFSPHRLLFFTALPIASLPIHGSQHIIHHRHRSYVHLHSCPKQKHSNMGLKKWKTILEVDDKKSALNDNGRLNIIGEQIDVWSRSCCFIEKKIEKMSMFRFPYYIGRDKYKSTISTG